MMTFMCLMMKILKISSPSNSTTENSRPPYKLSGKSKGPSKIPRPKTPLAQFEPPRPRPLGERNQAAGPPAGKKRFGKLRKIGHKIRKLGGYEKGTLPTSQRELGANAEDGTTRSSQGGGLMSLKSADLNYNTVRSTDSFSLSQHQQNQLEFIQDNIDYQWFIDYGYRDGASSLQRSSILSASCYDDLSRDLDTTLAHVDMEDFSHEDINSLLHALPPMCVGDMQDHEGEMYSSLPSTSPHSSSLVKSGPLFSPVKEVPLPPAGTYSVDSLDCDEMMITCQHPNKHNYTIAFQGSTVMTNSDTNESSDDGSKSQPTVAGPIAGHSSIPEKPLIKCLTDLKCDSRGVGPHSAEMTNSDSPLTTWSKLKRQPEPVSSGLSRASSGNNNSAPIGAHFDGPARLDFKPLQSACSVPSLLQTQSLPNLVSNKHQQWLLRNKLLALNSSINAAEKAFDVPIKLFDIAQSTAASSTSNASLLLSESLHSNTSTSKQSGPPVSKPHPKHTTTPSHQPNFSLLKLFIKQKNALDFAPAAPPGDDNLNYMSWNDESTGETGSNATDKANTTAANMNVAWATRIGANGVNSPSRGKNLNRAKYLSENNNNEYSYDSLTAVKNGQVDNEEHMSVSQVSERYCDCDISSQNEAVSSQEMGESSDSFSSHTNRPTVRSMGKGSTSEDTLGTETSRRDSKGFPHRVGCPVFDKSIQTSHHMAASASKSQQSKTSSSGASGGGRQVYVLYPNYTLPDLSFLQDHATELDLNNVFLWPQKFEPSPVVEQAPPLVENKTRGRPMSCVDIDTLKRKGFRHVRDWNSLIYLLPREYTRLLSDVPEIAAHLTDPGVLEAPAPTPLFCKKRAASCGESTTSSSNAPSSGYRGSSSILNEETSSNPLFIYRYDSVSSESSMLGGQAPSVPKRHQSLATGPDETAPPRPPLPRSILRHPPLGDEHSKLKNKRFSMYEFGSKENLVFEEASNQQNNTTLSQPMSKRASLPSNFINKKDSCGDHVWEDEGVEVGGTDTTVSSELHEDPAQRLEHLLEETDSWAEKDISTLRAQVIKFLNCNNKEAQQRKVVSFVQTPPNSPNSGNSNAKQLYQCKLQSGAITGVPIHEERESSSPESKVKPQPEAVQKDLIEGVIKATRHLVNNYSSEQIGATSHIVLNSLCPALYALLNEGLRPALTTSFGDTPNSVWQVIEASAQPGPSTHSLHDLVLRLNSEDILLSEGLLKFNAFVFGLLNIRGLDTWLSLVATRESLVRRHYAENSLLAASCRGLTGARTLVDLLINALKPLNALPFKLDLLYQCRTLHESLCAMAKNSPVSPFDSSMSSLRTSWTLKKLIRSITASQEEGFTRPRSCVEVTGDNCSDVASSANKRWSTLGLGSKLASAFQSLVTAEDDEYPDSLEPEPPAASVTNNTSAASQPLENKRLTSLHPSHTADDTSSDLSDMPDLSYNSEVTIQNSAGSKCTGGKFKRLQQRWEMLSGTPLQTPASSPVKSRSRIPRPVSSPTPPPSTSSSKPSGLPLAKPVARKPPLPSPTSTGPALPLIRKPALSPTSAAGASRKFPPPPSASGKFTMDGKAGEGPQLLPSKMSLPARPSRVDGVNPRPPACRPSSLPYRKPAVGSERRAASTGVGQRQSAASATHKYVKTLSHRLPADNGHLSYNAGERLKVVLEVDDTWLLCCRGRQKGLVPRSAVILY